MQAISPSSSSALISPGFTTTQRDQWSASLIGMKINFFSKTLIPFFAVHFSTPFGPSSNKVVKKWDEKQWTELSAGVAFRVVLETMYSSDTVHERRGATRNSIQEEAEKQRTIGSRSQSMNHSETLQGKAAQNHGLGLCKSASAVRS